MDLMTFMELARSAWAVWFTLVFVGIVFWAYRPKNKARFEEDAMIIFKHNGEKGGHAHG